MEKKLKALERLMSFFDVLFVVIIILALVKAAVNFLVKDWITGVSGLIVDIIIYAVLCVFRSRLKDVLMSIIDENYSPNEKSINEILANEDLLDYEREVLTEINKLSTSPEILDYLRERKKHIDELIGDDENADVELYAEQSYLAAMIAEEEDKAKKELENPDKV